MGIMEWMKRVFAKGDTCNLNTQIEEYSTEAYFNELAIACAINMIANTISKCEFKTYVKGEATKKEEYYLWNVSPNKNQNSSDFIKEIITKMCYDNECLVVEHNGELHIADSFNKTEYVIYEWVFDNVTIRNFTFNKKFLMGEVLYFKMNNMEIKCFLDRVISIHNKNLMSEIRSFRKENSNRGILDLSTLSSRTQEYQTELRKLIEKRIKPYFENDNAVLPLQKGEKFIEKENKNKNSRDIKSIIDDIFELTARAFRIPVPLFMGNVANIEDAVKNYLTFAIDPLVDNLNEEINKKRYGYQEYTQGNYLEINSNAIIHVDIFEMAAAVEKIIGSGFFCIDETRIKLGEKALNTDWSKKYYMTKNFTEVENLNNLGGGEKNDNERNGD